MALYLGNNKKLKVRVNNSIYKLIVPVSSQIVDKVRLLSFDNYVLKDSNGVYLTAKEAK
jgi:hypothetical protein